MRPYLTYLPIFTILYEKLLFVDSSSRNFGGYVVYLPYAMTDYIYFSLDGRE